MGLFTKKNTKVKQSYNATIIADDCVIVGGINTKSDVIINGKFEGVLLSAGNVTIGDKGEVYGDVKASNIIVSGTLDGVADASFMHILSTGKVIGRLEYSKITIEENGFIDGKTTLKGSSIKSRYSEIENKYHNLVDTKVIHEDIS
jgi:cytoskeletal protein CcmA (bactofilin family)